MRARATADDYDLDYLATKAGRRGADMNLYPLIYYPAARRLFTADAEIPGLHSIRWNFINPAPQRRAAVELINSADRRCDAGDESLLPRRKRGFSCDLSTLLPRHSRLIIDGSWKNGRSEMNRVSAGSIIDLACRGERSFDRLS